MVLASTLREKNMSPIRPEAITKLDKSLGVLESFGFVFEGLITKVESAR
jgi:hypothetical protein